MPADTSLLLHLPKKEERQVRIMYRDIKDNYVGIPTCPAVIFRSYDKSEVNMREMEAQAADED